MNSANALNQALVTQTLYVHHMGTKPEAQRAEPNIDVSLLLSCGKNFELWSSLAGANLQDTLHVRGIEGGEVRGGGRRKVREYCRRSRARRGRAVKEGSEGVN